MSFKKKNLLKRAFSLFLVFVMCVGMLQVTAFALEEGEITSEEKNESSGTENLDAPASEPDPDPEPGPEPEPDPEPDDSDEPKETEPEGDDDDAGAGNGETPTVEPTYEEPKINPPEVNEREPEEIDPEDAPVPGDASERVDVTTSTDPVTGNETETTTTDKTWGSSSKAEGEFSEKEDVTEDETQSETVDKLTGENAKDNLDGIQDGTYTKTEEQTKTDVEVSVSGEEHRTDTETTTPDGDPVRDSFEVNGQQTTTVTETETNRTTTTEVEKGTEVTETNPGLEQVTNTTEKEPDGKAETTTITGEYGKPVQVGKEIDTSQTIKNEENQGGNIKVTLTPDDPKKVVKDEKPQTPTLPNLKEIFEHCAGWKVKDERGNVIGTLDSTGKVTTTNGGTYQAGFKPSDDGKTWTFTLSAEITRDPTKVGEETEVKTGVTGSVGDLVGDKTVTTGEVGTKFGEYGEGVVDGNKTTYTKEDVTSRTDLNEWTEITKITEEEWEQLTEYFDRTITVTMGKPREVTGNLKIEPGKDNGKLTLTVGGNKLTDKDGNLTFDGKPVDGAYMVGDQNGGRDFTHLYAIKGDSGTILGYCVEKGVHNAGVGNGKYQLVNLQDAFCDPSKKDFVGSTQEGKDSNKPEEGKESYLTANDIKHLNYIAAHGYWGGGQAELDEFNKTVGGSFTAEQAISITQAAVWRYADPANRQWGDIGLDYYDSNGNHVKVDPYKVNGKDSLFLLDSNACTTDRAEQRAAMSAYTKLIASENKLEGNQTQIVTESDITSATITVKEKVNSVEELTAIVTEANDKKLEEGGVKVDSKDTSDQYKVDAAVTMAITPSKIGDELMLYVYVGNKVVASSRLSTNEKGEKGTYTINRTGNDKTGYTYSVENLVVGEGVEINFRIKGNQKLNEGVYLFQDESYQNMAALVKGGSKHNVDINVKMDFSVTEGRETVKDHQESSQEKVTRTDTNTTTQKFKSESEYVNITTTVVTITETETIQDEIDTTIDRTAVQWSDRGVNYYGSTPEGDDDDDDDDDITTVPEDPTPTTSVPEETTVEVPEEAAPLAEAPAEETLTEIPEEETPLEELEEIPEEETPLADVPETGDDPTLLCAMSALCAASLMGLAVLALKRRQEA